MRISSLVSLLSLPAALVSAFDCSIPPIYVDIHKRIVHGTDTFQYGAFIGVGTPGQNQSLWPSLSQNETSVADINFCKQSNLADCERSTRGDFDSSESPTFIRDNSHISLDNTSAISNSTFAKDAFSLYTHYFETNPATATTLSSFPFQLALNSSISPGILGFGQTSSLLSSLFTVGLIAGRTFGLYVGSGMDRAGGVVNGSITFGGYDAGRFTGEVHNYTMDTSTASALRVEVVDLVLDELGTDLRDVSLFDGKRFPGTSSSSFDALLSTDDYPLALPKRLTQNFVDTLRANSSDAPDGSLMLPRSFNGTLTVVLADGLRVQLPPDVMYNASGLTAVKSWDEGRVPASKNGSEHFYLGNAFLAQVYLMVDYDAYKFHLARAIAEPQFVIEKTFCPRTVPSVFVSDTRNFWNSGLIGAVIGGVIGGLGVILLTSCLACAWYRRKRDRADRKEHKESWEVKGKKMAQFEFEEVSSDSESGGRQKKRWWMFWRR